MSISRGLEHLGFISLVDFSLREVDGEVIFEYWKSDQPQPSIAEIETASTAWHNAYDNDYARKRKEEYPSVDELVVALWEGVVEERMAAVTKLEGKRQAVKTKYPK
jgi:hypothetical protein